MKIPNDPMQRIQFYQRVLQQCLVSQNNRIPAYRRLRNYYLFGTEEGTQAPFNKIQPTIQLLKSFIYSAETTKFNLQLGATVHPDELRKVSILNEEINDQWHDSDTDLIIGDAIQWSYVYNTMILKIVWDDGIKVYSIEPDCFGVFREDINQLNRQEAVVHIYMIPKSELERIIETHPHKDIVDQQIAVNNAAAPDSSFPSGLQRLMISKSTPNMIGSVAGGVGGMASTHDYVPDIDYDGVTMYELYIWNDDEQDYQIVTLADPGIVIYDRKNFLVPKKLPFVQICPEPLPFYFWGQSFTARLTPLQDWHSLRIAQLKDMMNRQVDPPRAASGSGPIREEKYAALRKAGGYLDLGINGKIEDLSPKMPTNMFAEIEKIEEMFNETAGVNNIMQGKGESGVRSRGQADLMARLSSSRPRQASLIIEDALEQLATLVLRLHQEFSDKKYLTDETLSDGSPMTFVAKQFTTDYIVKVDAHSSSPIFIEDKKSDAQVLLKAQCIDREDFLRLYDPPGLQQLVRKLKIRIDDEKKQMQMQQQMMQMGMAGQGRPPSPGAQQGAANLRGEKGIEQASE
ncbi:hypothetical protein [Paludibacterium sp.]|uniref:portal protein n=1 Tax=Paludibacterium sp. TaxID=1917523 RepID=UPI0025DA6F25|nr:hypothetical protein [Paludibacterium sp.]MBV8648471.1 hypothetical protein [Paludibacterium sp.]